MNLSFLAHLPLAVTVPAVVLFAAGAAFGVRAAARYVTARGGQNWETVLLLGFFGAAATLSADGLLGFARRDMGLRGPLPVVFWLALDGAAGMLLSMVRRRAREGRSTWHVRAVVWTVIAASASFNWLHAPGMPGAHLAWAAMPAVAGILAELAVADIRQEQAEARRAEDGPAPERRVEAARWLHPAESLRVMSAMAADAALSSADATREVRADAAARALYRLRRAMKAAGETPGISVRMAERRAQSAFRRAGFASGDAPEDILRRMQGMVRLPDFASLDYGTAKAAKDALGSLIDRQPKTSAGNPPDGDGETRKPAAPSGSKDAAARKWWDRQIAAGKDPWAIEAREINDAAGASGKSSFGRTFKRLRIAEMNSAAGDPDESGDGEAVV